MSTLFGIGRRYRKGFTRKFVSSPAFHVLRRNTGHRHSNTALFNKKMNHKSYLFKLKRRK